MKKVLTMITALLFNIFMGATVGFAMGFAPAIGAVGAVGLSAVMGAFMPMGALSAGVLTEVWTGELVKKFRSDEEGSFLDGITDNSQYAENDVIHMVDISADPDVLVNNTTYPLAIQALVDGDIALKLDKFQTKATPITDDELYALSYDKMASVKERHGAVISESKFAKAIHALAPDVHAVKTPVLKTTGGVAGGAAAGRMMLTRKDIIALKTAFDKAKVPLKGRRLVLCPDHIADLLQEDQVFAAQYYNYESGKIANLYSFAVYENVDNPFFKTADGKKIVFGTAPTADDFQASVAFSEKRVFKASGTTKMYFSSAETDPLNQRNLVNFRHYFVALPNKKEAIAAIMSDTKAEVVEEAGGE